MLVHARKPWHLTRILRCIRLAHTAREARTDNRWSGWEVVVGIEVHAQIKSRAKLFSDSWTSDYSVPSNTRVSPYDAAFPGTLPRLNPQCVELGVRTALALDANVHRQSTFDRKHYFYADLPSGYQITQHYAPFATGGGLKLDNDNAFVRIKQIQLEQDTGKSTFDPLQGLSSIDLNRAGTGLMEIVSEPDMRSPEEAGTYVRALQALLRAIGASDGNMEQGSLRCDVNVSVNRKGAGLGTRCEIKNLNSVKFMMVAITAEAYRHIELLERGEAVPQETRGFNEASAETYTLRIKEDAPDYRYMPDPNLPPLLLDEAYIDTIRRTMPELPPATRARLIALGLSTRDADVLMDIDAGRDVGAEGAVAYFDRVAAGREPKAVVNWITHELLGQLAKRRETFADNLISVAQMGELVDLVQAGRITGTAGKTVLRQMLDTRTSDPPSMIAEQLALFSAQSGGDALGAWCAEAVAALPDEADAVRRGNVKVVNKIVGRVMQISRGTADAQAARDALLKMLQ